MSKSKKIADLPVIVFLLLATPFIIRMLRQPGQRVERAMTGSATRDGNMALGNPSGAGTADKNNYLLVSDQYALSYNNGKGIANWVSWHLSTAWQGNARRCNCFKGDERLPAGFSVVQTSDYVRSGFDRGHLCPSDDRSASDEDNAATFTMTNIAPQAPELNQKSWERLEAYCRKLTTEGNELYIIAGAYGSGGEGRNGTADNIAGGRINVPARFWKVIIVLPVGDNDVRRIDKNTRVIAVDMPNDQAASEYEWGHYRTTVDAIEVATGYDLFSSVSAAIQQEIEAVRDEGPVN